MLRRLVPLVCAMWVLLALDRPPVLDEESYLDIGAQIAAHPWRPYDWWRPWQPWGASHPPDAYLYAHPPLHLLWVSAAQALLGWGPALRALVALPFAILLGLSAVDLALAWTRRPALASALFLSSPVLVLALQSGLMPDLGVVAWSLAAVAAHRRAEGSQGWALLAGVLLGLACGWKYPALVLLPLLLWTCARPGALLLGFCAIWLPLELLLWAEYGRPHLWEVLRTAGQLGRGPLESRAWGTLMRLGLVLSPLALLARPRWGILLALGVGAWAQGRALGVALEFSWAERAWAAGLLACGLVSLGVAWRGHQRLLSLWVALALGAVVLGHNYAGGRYLLPLVLPLALLVAEQTRWARLAWLGAGLWAALSVGLSQAEDAQARAAVAVAEKLAEGQAPGRFTGEWSFRWRMQTLGWRFWSPGEPLQPGERLAAPTVSSPAELPPLLLPLRAVSAGEGALRLTDPREGLGYHAETLGPLPLGLGEGPLEQGTLYELP